MAGLTTATGEVAAEYCRKYPAAPSLQLARMLQRDQPALYATVEIARRLIRYYRGAHGSFDRGCAKRAGSLIERITLPKPEETRFKVYPLPSGPKRWLLLADLHVPYYDNKAIEIAVAHGKREKCDGVLINGDGQDYYQLSSWQRDPRRRRFVDECEDMVRVIKYIRQNIKPKAIVYKKANHEYRLDRYLMQHAPELFEMAQWCVEDFYEERGLNVTWIPRGCPIQHEELTILHGDEWHGGTTSPVNAARTAFLKTRECCIVAHLHQTSEHTEPTVRGTTITCWSLGALCDLHPEYSPLNRWNSGFGILRTGKRWEVSNYRIVKGRVV